MKKKYLLLLGAIAAGILSARTTAWALDWPVAPTTSVHRVLSSYGQFAQDTEYDPILDHFHEGVDIAAAEGENIYAIEMGTDTILVVIP